MLTIRQAISHLEGDSRNELDRQRWEIAKVLRQAEKVLEGVIGVWLDGSEMSTVAECRDPFPPDHSPNEES